MLPLEPGAHLCQLDCDPLAQDCPADIFGCYPGLQRLSCGITLPVSAQDGGACEYHRDCISGTLCTGSGALPNCAGGSCCTGYCDLDQPEACAASALGDDCVALFDADVVPPGLEHLGLCLG